MYLVRGVMEPANTNCKHFCCFTHLHLGTCRPTASPTFGNYRAMFTMFTSHVIPLGGWLVYGEPICACKELSMAISSGCVLYSLIENWLSIQIKYGAEHEFNGHNQFVIQTAQNGHGGENRAVALYGKLELFYHKNITSMHIWVCISAIEQLAGSRTLKWDISHFGASKSVPFEI